ncbi:MAG: radical SAM protein [Candidatus Kryptoniota bacterium]
MNYKKSHYNVTVKTEEGARLFNARTGAIVEISSMDPLFPDFEESWKHETFNIDDHEWFQPLKDGQFIIPEELNEIPDYIESFNTRQRTTDRTSLIVLPTEECNFRCVYCYENFLKPQMSEETQDALKKYLTKTMEQVRGFSIEWFGGEPLLGMDVIRNISTDAVRVAEEHNIPYTAAITTNGYLLTPEVFEEAVSDWKIFRYQITIDGPREFHDHRRPLEEGGSTFDQIISNLRYVAKADHPEVLYIVRMNVDSDNLKTVPEFARLIKDIVGDDKRARFYVRPTWGKSKFELLTDFESRSLRKQIVDICAEVGLYLYDSDLVLNPALGMCYAADPHSLVIGPDGSVYKCTSAFDLPENLVGRLAVDGTMQLDHERFDLWVESSIEKYPQCRRCAVLPICNSAHCPKREVTRAKLKDGRSPHPVCPSYKDEVKLFVESALQEESIKEFS